MPHASRRDFCRRLSLALGGATLVPSALAEKGFQLRYILASCLYGEMSLAEILPEVRKTGAEWIDLWPRPHGNQREQIDTLGHDQFAALLREHQIKLGMITRYGLGPFKLGPEMQVLKKLGGKIIVAAGSGPKNLAGPELKAAVKQFAEQMKPHIAAAEESGVTIAIENHGNNLIDSPDSLKWLVECVPSQHLGLALAPYHLPDDATTVANLIKALGQRIVHFYAWQHGMGCATKLPKEQELMQLPGRGKLDFTPIIQALKQIDYQGWISIFMHPVPRGIPILEKAGEVTAEINRAKSYLEKCLKNK